MATESILPAKNVKDETPYKLDTIQTLRASKALLKHIGSKTKQKETLSTTKNLLISDPASPDAIPSDVEPIWLILTSKKFITDQHRLKPRKVALPHSLHTSPSSSICLITPEPQRQFKDAIAHPSFPPALSNRITRVISIKKLEAKYQSFETKRQLRDSHDLFLADDRIITYLSKILGKTFYKSTPKRPIPVSLEASKPKERKNAALPSIKHKKNHSDSKSIATPALLAKEIEHTLSTAQIHLTPSTTTAVRVGLASFTPEQLAANIEAMMAAFVAKFVGWRNVKSVHIKGPNTMALPIWLAQELWLDEGMVLEEEEVKDLQMKAAQKGKRERKLVQGEKAGEPEAELKPKRKRVDGEDEMSYEPRQKKASKVKDGDLSQEMSKRREKLRQPKDASGGPVVENALRSKFLSEDSRKVKTSKKNIAAV